VPQMSEDLIGHTRHQDHSIDLTTFRPTTNDDRIIVVTNCPTASRKNYQKHKSKKIEIVCVRDYSICPIRFLRRVGKFSFALLFYAKKLKKLLQSYLDSQS